MDTFGPQSLLFGFRKERLPRFTLEKEASFSAPHTCTLPLPPTLHVYIGKYHTTKYVFLDPSSLCFSNSSINGSVY